MSRNCITHFACDCIQAELERIRAELKDLLILGKDFSHGMTSKQFEDHCKDKLKKIDEALK